MSPEKWARVQEIFLEAETMDAAARALYISKACEGDTGLQGEVESLLKSSESSGTVLEVAMKKAVGLAAASQDPFLREGRVGAYKLERLIGSGGMGSVYLASRADSQFEKQVAIKLVRSGLDSPEIMQRFLSERQILAKLDHPNIARMLDGGTLSSGQPYVVMEYVDGLPIDAYCAQHNLSREKRLRLFLQICDAIQYAHRNLIIHRDLKPGNILVTEDEIPKLLDFGIAKLLQQDGEILVTRPADRMMTPEYASPEQVAGDPVTTASDVYSLGVLLYVLLAGQLPYRLKTRTGGELERAVLEDEARPHANLDGDLLQIIRLAMRKEPHLRYASASHFANDIAAYLSGFPVAANKGAWTYRTGKFLRRHMVASVAAALALIALIAFGTVMAVLAKRLAEERDTAQNVTQFLVDLFEVSNPGESRANTITAREILDRGAENINKELQDQPKVRAKMLETMGSVFKNLGLYNRSVQLFEESVKLRRSLGEKGPELVVSLQRLADSYRVRNEYKKALPLADEALRHARDLPLGNLDPLALALNTAGLVRQEMGDSKSAKPMFEEAIALRRNDPPGKAEVTIAMSNLATLLQSDGDLPGAEKLLREILAIRRARFGEEHARVGMALHKLGVLLAAKGNFDEAEVVTRQALALRRKVLPAGHPEIRDSMNELASLLQDKGNYPEARKYYEESLASALQTFGENNRSTAIAMNNLASLEEDSGNLNRAEELQRKSLEIRRTVLGENHTMVARSLTNLARVMTAKGDYPQAETLVNQAQTIRAKILPAGHGDLAVGHRVLGSIWEKRGNMEGAKAEYQKALEIQRAATRPGHPNVAIILTALGSLAVKQGKTAEAEPMLREAVQIQRKELPETHWLRANSIGVLGECLLDEKQYAQAEPLLVESSRELERWKDIRPAEYAASKKRMADLRQALSSR